MGGDALRPALVLSERAAFNAGIGHVVLRVHHAAVTAGCHGLRLAHQAPLVTFDRKLAAAYRKAAKEIE